MLPVDPEVFLRFGPGSNVMHLFARFDPRARGYHKNLWTPASMPRQKASIHLKHTNTFRKEDCMAVLAQNTAHHLSACLVDAIETSVVQKARDPVANRCLGVVDLGWQFLRKNTFRDRKSAQVLPFGASKGLAN
jgi:hypothetical protein